MPLYGDIVRDFYKIGLTDADALAISHHFSGAVHHHSHAVAARNAFVAQWHAIRFRAHLRHLMIIVFERGDFAGAIDPTNQGKEERDFWHPDFQSIPTSDMLVGEGLGSDPCVPPLVPHPLDSLLKNLLGPTEHPASAQKRCS